MMMLSCFLLWAFLNVLPNFEVASAQTWIDVNNPVVSTTYGSVKGSKYTLTQLLKNNNRYSSNLGVTYVQFISIPYAAPPTGVNRFRPPKIHPTWSQVLDCTGENRVMCPQVYQRFKSNAAIREDEDCLYLNIFVPVVANSYSALPVLVYIHGGEFRYGGKDFYKPDFLLQARGFTTNNFIIVTINYRLGVLGFLSTDDFNSPGNVGIRDQAEALKWVNENIAKFGGNPSNVTIMGHDAGGISVSFHLLNPEVDPYFNRAISISGTIFTPWAISDNPLAMARDFAFRFSCGYREDQIVECLRYQDLNQLMSTSRTRDWGQNMQPFWFRPVVDRNVSSALLKDFPYKLYKSGNFNKKEYLVITTGKEGSLEYYLQLGRMPTTIDGDPTSQIAFLIRPYLKYYTKEKILALALKYKYFNKTSRLMPNMASSYNVPNANPSVINSQYTLHNQINTGGYNPFGANTAFSSTGYSEAEYNDQFCYMLGDFLYTGPIDMAARLHSAQAKVMMMVFEFYDYKSFGPLQNDLIQQVTNKAFGATHFNDLFYLMPNEYDTAPLQPFEMKAATEYTNFVAQFVLNGIPKLSSFPEYKSQNPRYTIIDTNGNTIPKGDGTQAFRQSYVDFINDYIYDLMNEAAFYPPYFPQQEYKSYQQATWALVGVLILVILIAVILAIVLIVRKRKEHIEEKNERGREQVALKHRYDDRSAYISD